MRQQANVSRRALKRAEQDRGVRRTKRGVPEVGHLGDPGVIRARCIEHGMPAHYNSIQAAAWLNGDKCRGPGITR